MQLIAAKALRTPASQLTMLRTIPKTTSRRIGDHGHTKYTSPTPNILKPPSNKSTVLHTMGLPSNRLRRPTLHPPPHLPHHHATIQIPHLLPRLQHHPPSKRICNQQVRRLQPLLSPPRIRRRPDRSLASGYAPRIALQPNGAEQDEHDF